MSKVARYSSRIPRYLLLFRSPGEHPRTSRSSSSRDADLAVEKRSAQASEDLAVEAARWQAHLTQVVAGEDRADVAQAALILIEPLSYQPRVGRDADQQPRLIARLVQDGDDLAGLETIAAEGEAVVCTVA